MNIEQKISLHLEEVRYSRVSREITKDWEEISRGYIIDRSEKFVVLQECDDFEMAGFNVLPIKQIKKIRYNRFERYYDKIMDWEHQKKHIGLKTRVDLKSWQTVFETFQEKKAPVIVECENSWTNAFSIGAIVKITNKSVQIHHFDADGYLRKKPVKIKFKEITKVIFDDRYIDVFSKYIRTRK